MKSMTHHRSLPIALTAVIALVCCLAAGGLLAGGAASMNPLSMPRAGLSIALNAVRQAAEDVPLAQLPIYVSGFGRDYGMRPGSAFAGNFLGGFLGAGLGGLLFGGGFFGAMHGAAGALGVLAQMLLVYSISVLIYRRCASAMSPVGSAAYARLAYTRPARPRGNVRPGFFFGDGTGGRPNPRNPGDCRPFEELLHRLQAAWCSQDMPAIRTLASPDMADAYQRKLSDLKYRHLREVTGDLVIRRTEVTGAWSDASGDHATVQFEYTMIEATLDAWDRAVDGHPTEPVLVRECWMFERSAGGNWQVSAIDRAG